MADQQIIIVDSESLTPCDDGQIGEVWVSGPNVTRGYWGRPEETDLTFHAHLADAREPFLRTGDLGFLTDGELFITGRIKDLIIIGGRNYYPQEIEQTVEESHTELRPGCGAAFSVEVEDTEHLVIVQEVERPNQHLDVDAIVTAIRHAVAEHHELRAYAVRMLKAGTIPKTSSGKIQRRACRDGFIAGTLDVIN